MSKPSAPAICCTPGCSKKFGQIKRRGEWSLPRWEADEGPFLLIKVSPLRFLNLKIKRGGPGGPPSLQSKLFLFGGFLFCGGLLFCRQCLLTPFHDPSLVLAGFWSNRASCPASSTILKVFGAIFLNRLSRDKEMAMEVIGVFPLIRTPPSINF